MSEEMTSEDFESTLQEIAGSAPDGEEVARLVAEFGVHIGVPDLQLSETGEACIALEDGLVVSLFQYENLPSLVAVAPLPKAAAQDEAIVRGLLRANMSWARTNGGTFAMAPDSDVPLLLCQIPLASLDVEALDARLTDFVELVRLWHGDIKVGLEAKDKAGITRQDEPTYPANLV